MSDPNCRFHPDKKAHRITHRFGPLCDDCFRNGPPQIPDRVDYEFTSPANSSDEAPKIKVKQREEKTVMAKKSDVDWIAVQDERSQGVSVPELSKKYGVSQPTIYTRTRPAGKSGKSAKKPSKSPLPRVLLAVSPKGGRFAGAIAELTAERDCIQGLIDKIAAMA